MGSHSSRYRVINAAAIEQRRAPRRRVLVSSSALCLMGEIALSAELFDISSFGCRISVDAVFSPGEEIQIALADFEPVIATAVWQKGRAVGCRFLHPISSDILHSLTLEE